MESFTLSATESELISKIDSAKKDQGLLNVQLQKIMEEAHSKPLAEKAFFIKQMTEFQSKISASTALMNKLEADLKTAQMQKELAEQKNQCSVQNNVSNSSKLEINNDKVEHANSLLTSRFNPANAIFKNKEQSEEKDGLMAAINCLKKGNKIVLNTSQTAETHVPHSIFKNKEKPAEGEILTSVADSIRKVDNLSSIATSHHTHSIYKNKETPTVSDGLTSAIDSLKKGGKIIFNSNQSLTSHPTHVIFKNKETPTVSDGLTSAIESLKKGGKIIFNSNQSLTSQPTHVIFKDKETPTVSDGLTSAIDSLKKGDKITFNSNQLVSRFHPSMAIYKNKKPPQDNNEEVGEVMAGTPGNEDGLLKAMDSLKSGKKITINTKCPSRFDPSRAIRKNCSAKSVQDVLQPGSDEKTASETKQSREYVEISCSGLKKSNDSTGSEINPILSEHLKMPFLHTTSVCGDGSCFMYGSLEQLKYPELQAGANMSGMDCHINVRKTTCKFLRTNKELQGLEAFLYMKNNAIQELASRRNVPEGSISWSNYLEEMENNTSCMADATFLQAFALCIGKDLLITSPTNTSDQPWTLVEGTIEGSSFKSHGLPLTFFRNNKHYEPITRLKTETRGCRGCGEITEDISSHLTIHQRRRCYVFYGDLSPGEQASHQEPQLQSPRDSANPTTGDNNVQSSHDHSEHEPQLQAQRDNPNPPEYETSVHDEVHDVPQESDMKVYDNECNKCHIQLANVNSLEKHKKSTGGECLSFVCKDSHDHDFLVKKFDTEKDVEDFIGDIDGSWKKERCRGDRIRMTCNCTKGCKAKLRFQAVTRPEGTREFVLQACLGHEMEDFNIDIIEMQMALEGQAEKKVFPNEAAAREYIEQMEFDSFFRRMVNEKRKDGSTYQYYQCRRKEKYTPTTYSSKKNTGCTSKFTLSISPEGPVTMRSVLKHNHEDDEHSVMSQKEKGKAAAAFKHGVSVKTYMDQQYAVPSHERTKGRLGDRSDFRRLHQKNAPQKVDITKEEKENVLKSMENPAWRQFSLKQHYGDVPEHLKHKEVKRDFVFMFYMSDQQRKILAQYPQTLHMDGSHGTNRHGLQWVNFMVFDNRGAGIPVGHALVPEESEESVTPALEIMKKLEPEACEKIEYVSTDLAKSFMNAFTATVKAQVKWIPCAWHLERAWRTNLQKSVPKMYKDIQELRLEITSIDNFNRRYTILNDYYTSPAATQIERKKWKYFTDNYSEESGLVTKPSEWARVYQKGCVPHNLYVERLHGEFKEDNKKGNMRIDELMFAIEELANKKEYHFIMRRQRKHIGVKDSQAVRLFNYNHNPMKGYHIEVKEDYDGTYYIVKKEATDTEEEKTYVLCPNKFVQCSGVTCQVRCKTCPSESPCSHKFTCTCTKYARSNICKHQHHLHMHKCGVPHTRAEPMKKPRVKRGVGQMPTLSVKRKHEHQPQFGKLPIVKKRKNPKEATVIDPRQTAITKSLILMISKKPKSKDWGNWVCGDESQFYQFLKPLTFAEKARLLEKYQEARSHWKCFACPDQTMEKHKRGWVSCQVCHKLCHISCSPFETKEQATSSGPWHCCSCRQKMRQHRQLSASQ